MRDNDGKQVERKSRTRPDPAVKAQVMAALLVGQRVAEVAEQTGVPVYTVHEWWRAARDYGPGIAPDDAARIGSLLRQHLESGLETVIAQYQVMRDPEWCREQGASELAVCHGVLVDKLVRVLEATEPTGEPLPPTYDRDRP